MYDVEVARILRVRLRQAQENDITTRFGIASLNARFTGLIDELDALPADKHPEAAPIVAALRKLEAHLSQRDDAPEVQAENLMWRLVELLQRILREMR